MFSGPYTYLLLNVFTLMFPLLLSFDKKVAFFTKWKHFFPAMLLTGAFFIVWDVWFTEKGVWSFNPDYLIGINILNLPLEEWLFFFTIPYACVFIYECLRCWFSLKISLLNARYFSIPFASILMLVALLNYDKMYTSITFFLLAVMVLVQFVLFKTEILRNFIPAYAIAIGPFFLVNGILTSNPVVIYNDLENLAFRIWTVPFEDIFYGMLLILMNITLMELFRQRTFARSFKLKPA